MNKNDKNLIERYFNGKVDGDDLIKINRLILEDEEFSRRFEIRKALKEASELHNNFQYTNELDSLLKNHHKKVEEEKLESEKLEKEKLRRKRAFRFSFAGVAALLIIAGIFYWYINKVRELALDIDYFETNVKKGLGLSSPDNKEPIYGGKVKLKILLNTESEDSTYHLINYDSLNVKMPRLDENIKSKDFSMVYDHKADLTFLIIKRDSFTIKENSKYEKLIRYKR